MRKIWQLALLALLVIWGNRLESVHATPAQQTNLLTNPGLERPYVASGEFSVPTGWGRWHEERNANPKPDGCSASYAVRPGWYEENNSGGGLLIEGFSSAHVGNQFDTWHAGYVQDVNVTAGSRYRLTVWARGRASQDQFPAPSDTSVPLGVRVGIDPAGAGLWNSGTMVWGGAISPHDSWQSVSVEVTATGSKLTIALSADVSGANNCRAHLDVWFDQAELVVVGPPPTNTPVPQPTSPPPPPVTNTPVPPTATNTPEVTNTPVPPTATATATTPPGGTLCLNAFADTNSNGVHDPTEGFMANVTFTVAQGGSVVGTGVSRGTDSAVCFDSLPAGSYQVAQSVPAGLIMTTANSTVLPVEDGSTVGVEFGSRLQTADDIAAATSAAVQPTAVANNDGAANTPVPTTASSGAVDTAADDGGFDLLALSGLCAILLAILLLGVLIYVLMRQQRPA
ncbi:MAG: hypothetical protein H6651_12130 [Ardenticatenales bacterium]|nr:hypothetical protein [Ardenticatenales bacterium]